MKYSGRRFAATAVGTRPDRPSEQEEERPPSQVVEEEYADGAMLPLVSDVS